MLIANACYSMLDVRAIRAHLSPSIFPKEYLSIKEVQLPACLVTDDRHSRHACSFNRVHLHGLQCKNSLLMHTISNHTIFSCTPSLAEQAVADNVSATNPVYPLSFNSIGAELETVVIKKVETTNVHYIAT